LWNRTSFEVHFYRVGYGREKSTNRDIPGFTSAIHQREKASMFSFTVWWSVCFGISRRYVKHSCEPVNCVNPHRLPPTLHHPSKLNELQSNPTSLTNSPAVEAKEPRIDVRSTPTSSRKSRRSRTSHVCQQRSSLVSPTGTTLNCPPSILQGHDPE